MPPPSAPSTYRTLVGGLADALDEALVDLRAEVETRERELDELRALLLEVESRQRSSSLRAGVARRRRLLQPNESFGPLALVRDGDAKGALPEKVG